MGRRLPGQCEGFENHHFRSASAANPRQCSIRTTPLGPASFLRTLHADHALPEVWERVQKM